MNSETKYTIIILLVILITLRTIYDFSYYIYHYVYDIDEDDKNYNLFMTYKWFIDTPFLLLSILILFNISFNLRIFLFLFLGIFDILIDHYFEYLNIKIQNEKLIYFMEKYLILTLDSMILLIGNYILFKIFYVSK
jgi:hypothetical protein